MTNRRKTQELLAPPSPSLKSIIKILSWTRYVVALAVLGIFIGATVLIFIAAINMFNAVYEVVIERTSTLDSLHLVLIESVDFFLVATVLYVIATGMYQLFVNHKVTAHLPIWLQIHAFDNLERRLIGMVCVVTSVIFLGYLKEWDGQYSILEVGLGIGAIITASSLFIYLSSRSERETEQESEAE